MLARAADDIYWMARYVERAVAVVRLIDVTWHLELDAGDVDGDEDAFWAPLLGSGDGDGASGAPGGLGSPDGRAVRHHLAFDERNPGSLVSCIRQARTAARGVRESISSEMWEQLNTLYLSLVDPRLAAEAEEDPHGFYKRVREGTQFFGGLADDTLAHDEPWHFFRLGKYLERADNVVRALDLQSHLLLGQPTDDGETVRWLAVLRSCGSAEAYARYYSLRVEPARVIEFLLLNPVFPQSVRFSLGVAWEALREIAALGAQSGGPAVRPLGLLRARLEHAAVDEVLEEGVPTTLADIRRRIAGVSDQVTRVFLRPDLAALDQRRGAPATRAAAIMAAQQQQRLLRVGGTCG